jgi:CelD/BcsL family acetyltransferase involved in cellulose biosynthesis
VGVSSLGLQVLSKVSELERLREPWQQLVARSEAPSPMMTPTWQLAWWHTFGRHEQRELRALAMYREGRLVGLAPLLKRLSWRRPALPFRRLELIGSGEPEQHEICSDYIGIVAERGAERHVTRAFCQALTEGGLGSFDELVMPGMAGDTLLPALLATELRSRGLRVSLAASAQSPCIALPKTWDAYLAALPSSRRYMVRRSLRDFDHWADGQACLDIATTRTELEQGYLILCELHRERWSAEGKSGVFASQPFREFHARVMPELLELGELELMWLSVRGHPIAAHYNVVYAGTVYFYQSGRTLDLPAKVRPGIVMHAQAIQRAIAAGLRRYDFLAGASRYKTDLSLTTRPLVALRAVRPSLIEAAREVAEAGLRHARLLRGRVRDFASAHAR